MSVLTFAGVAIAVFTGLIFKQQLHEMRTDQRAWISISEGPHQFPKDSTFLNTVQVTAPITIKNIGKTSARLVKAEIVMDYEVKGDSPDFIYAGRARQITTTGIVYPDSTFTQNVPFSKGTLNSSDISPRFLAPSEFDGLSHGDYMVVYAQATYVDIFGTEHWTHFCTFFAIPGLQGTVTSRACTDYNGTDSN
jgi:hypothetical protein